MGKCLTIHNTNYSNRIKMEFTELQKDAEAIPFKDVTPAIQDPEATPAKDSPDTGKGFSFAEFAEKTPILGSQTSQNGQGGTQTPPTGENKPQTPKKPQGVAGFKAIGRVFEKVLNELCQQRHGMTLDAIGAGIEDKDLNLASDLYGEGSERGELPQIPSWITLVALIALIFAYPTYRVFTYKPASRVHKPQPVTTGMSASDFVDPGVEINPRTGKPYVRGKYNRVKRTSKK